MGEIMMENDNWYYDSPITSYDKELSRSIKEQLDGYIMQRVAQVGVDIDKEKLIQAITADEKRYVDAYNCGWKACMKHYGIPDDA